MIQKNGRVYARAIFPIARYPFITLHSLVLGCPKHTKYTAIDHINRDTTDNRKSNLRMTDKAINGYNRGKTKRKEATMLLPKGVDITPAGNFRAVSGAGGKSRYLGTFKTIKEAESAYISFSTSFYGI
jgi:hypothetical protein